MVVFIREYLAWCSIKKCSEFYHSQKKNLKNEVHTVFTDFTIPLIVTL